MTGVPCAEAPIGVATNCYAMGCWEHGCAVAAAKAAPPVLLDDLRPDVEPCRLCGSIFCAELCADQEDDLRLEM